MDSSIRLRKRFLPKTIGDLGAFLFIMVSICSIFIYEVFLVAPTVLPQICMKTFHIAMGSFMLFNILGNLYCMMAVDTSIKGLIFPLEVPPGWHVCSDCESIVPPRSKHCNTCKTCILKKEHHCIFAGYCVGLNNHRYFYMFLLYMWASTLYCSVLNAFFIKPFVGTGIAWIAAKIILPGIWLVWTPCMANLYTFLFSLNLFGFLFMSVLMFHYTNLLVKNQTTPETSAKNKKIQYDLGTKKNVKVVLGQKWYLTWLSPFILSPLPHDGTDWTSFQTRTKFKSK